MVGRVNTYIVNSIMPPPPPPVDDNHDFVILMVDGFVLMII